MKCIKRLTAVALAIALFSSLGINTYAEGIPATKIEENTPPEIEQLTSIPKEDSLPPTTEEQETDDVPVTVFSLEELTSAIDTAKDGDTILFGTRIYISADTAIGADNKNLVFMLNHDYNPDSFFYCDTQTCKNLSIKNIKFDGTQATGQMVAAIDCPRSIIAEKAVWTFENVAMKNFNTSWAAIIVFNADTYLDNCQFDNNIGSSVYTGSESYVEMTNCTLSNNSTTFRGGAIQCVGQMRLESCTIANNSAVNQESLQGEGGAVRVSYGGSCEILSSCITGNTADYGGGVYTEGEINLVDTFICNNTANYGGDDIYSFGGCVDVNYTDSVESIYKENAPVGFYADDCGNRFNSQTPTNMIGETISIKSYQNGLFGLKFVFADNLPPKEEKAEEEPAEEAPPATTSDNASSTFKEAEQDKQSVQEVVVDENSDIDSSVPTANNDTVIEMSEFPVEYEAASETTQPEQAGETSSILADKSKGLSAPWGSIIAVAMILSALGAIWLIKRKH